MHDPSSAERLDRRSVRRRVHERLSDSADSSGPPWIEPSDDFSDRVLARIDLAAPKARARPTRNRSASAAAAASVLLAAAAAYFIPGRPDDSGPAPPRVASILDLAGDSLGLDAAEHMLAREFDAIVDDARSMLAAVGASLPK